MSLSPENIPQFSPPDLAPEEPKSARRWQRRLLGICFAIFTFEIGLFLVIFPWMDDTWDLNYFNSVVPILQNVWDDPYFRGVLTGLGFVNIYIACMEVIRLFRRT